MARIFWLAVTVALVKLIFVQVGNDRVDSFLQVRNFYGTLHATQSIEPPDTTATRVLYHGTIEHGLHIFAPDMRSEPTTYYARDADGALARDLRGGNRAL